MRTSANPFARSRYPMAGPDRRATLCSDDETATHFLVRLVPSLAPVGTIRALRPSGKDYYKMGRLVVLKAYRQYRFGRALVLAVHEWVRRDAVAAGLTGHVAIVAHSQIPVKAFYAKYVESSTSQAYDRTHTDALIATFHVARQIRLRSRGNWFPSIPL